VIALTPPTPPLPSETGEGDVAPRRGARGCISVGCSRTGVAKAKVLKVLNLLKVLNFSGAGWSRFLTFAGTSLGPLSLSL
jgi:hypothetical protein